MLLELTNDSRNLADLIDGLEHRLDAALADDSAVRTQTLAQIADLIDRLNAAGQPVPLRLCALQRALQDDATDDIFDNMPV